MELATRQRIERELNRNKRMLVGINNDYIYLTNNAKRFGDEAYKHKGQEICVQYDACVRKIAALEALLSIMAG